MTKAELISAMADQAKPKSDIYEFYLMVTHKPRKTLIELLEDSCYLTEAGNWRPPLTEEEQQGKAVLQKIGPF